MAEASASVTIVGRALHDPWNEGTRVVGRNLALAARERGHDVRLVSLTAHGYGEGPDSSGLPTYHVRTRPTSPLRADYGHLRALAGAVRHSAGRRRSHLHFVGAPLALAPLVRDVAETTVAHVVLNARDTNLGPVDRVRAALGFRLFDRWVDSYAATSDAVLAALQRDGWNASKLRTLPPPIDTARFRRADPRPASGEGRLRVQYVGNIAGERFPAAIVIDALRALARQTGLRVALSVHAPVAFRPDNAEWASSLPDAEELEIDINLEDLTEARKAEVYSSADVMLYPYLRPVAVEPPLTLLEAMACEAVPVGTASANRSGVIVDGENGFIYAGTEQLTAQLARFAALGAKERARLGEAARRSIVQRFGRAATATQLERLWGELAERRRRPSADAHRQTSQRGSATS